jgi:hypothetical protein
MVFRVRLRRLARIPRAPNSVVVVKTQVARRRRIRTI